SCIPELEGVLAQESQHLASITQKEAMSIVLDCSAQRNGAAKDHNWLSFFDSLHENLNQAFRVVSQWIKLVERRIAIEKFTLQEIVNLELLTTKFSDAKRLRVKSSIQRHDLLATKDPSYIDGKYFHYFA